MKRILLTSAVAAALLLGTAAPASAATTTATSRCTVAYDSAGHLVLVCVLPWPNAGARWRMR